MSLAPAKQDVRDRPALHSVTEPVDRDQKNADVDRKLRLYGIATALRESRLPTNDQIDSALEFALKHSPVATEELSESGKVLIQDTRQVLDTMRAIVREKNADELLQNFVWHTRQTDTGRAKKDPNEVLPVGQDKVQNDANVAAQHLRTLATLIITNGEARKLIADFGVIGRDLLARGAGKVAEMARPDEDALRRVDEPGPDHHFVTEGGRNAGTNETPVPEVQVPGTGHHVAQDPRNEFGQGTTVKTESGEEYRGDEAANIASQRANEAKERAKAEAVVQRQDVQQNVVEDEADPETKKSRLQNKLSAAKDNVLGRVPAEHRDKAYEHKERARRFLSDEYFPPERRDQLVYRFKKVIIECQNHKDYQESMRWLLDTVSEYIGHGRVVADYGKDSHQQLTSDDNLRLAWDELRTLLERFANGASLDIISNAVQTLYEDSRKDEGLRNWFNEVNEFARRCLMEPGYILDDQANERGNQLRESGRQYYDEKYNRHFNNLWNSFADWGNAWTQDPLNRRFGQDWQRLAKDLLFDSEGSLKYKPELWRDIRKVVVPGLVANIGYVPIPRIEYTDDSFDVVLENLALSGKNVFPNIVSFEAHNYMKFSPYDTINDEGHHDFTLTLGHIQADLREVAFYYRRKSGFPKVTDQGLADVLLGGTGLTVTARLSSAHDPTSVFAVKDVQVKVDTLKFAVRDSKHDALYKVLAPLATSLIKKQLQRALGGAVQTALEYVDSELAAVRDQMAEAKASEEGNRLQVLKEQLAQKKQAAQGKTEEAGQKTGQFKVVAQPGAELLPEHGHPDGWVKRAGERVTAAKTGEEWRSDAYNIV